MKNIITGVFISFILISCNSEDKRRIGRIGESKWVDLTWTFDENTVYWPTSDPFKLDTVFEGETEGGYYYSAYKFSMAEHGGTHLDAPVHFARSKNSVDEIPVDQLIGQAVVIDVSDNALKDPDYQVSKGDIELWETAYGTLPVNSIVLLKTGYGQFWPDKNQYMGTSLSGQEGVENLHFPGLAPEAAEWLVASRKIKAIGIDTPSIDFGQSRQFKTHQILFRENIPVFENVARLEQLPEKGAIVIALPIKIKGGSGGPLRIIAKLP